MSPRLISVELRREPDLVAARQRARQLAGLLGYDGPEQTRIATAVSEIARNALRYAGGGRVEFSAGGEPAQLEVVVSDRGPGIPHLEEVLSGRYRSQTGLGLGIVGARRLMDRFELQSQPGQGTRVAMAKRLPRGTQLTPQRLDQIGRELARAGGEDPLQEVQVQNQELMATLDKLRAREQELIEANRELEDTNRGVVALYTELDERAGDLKRASELKTRFLSNMSHEFRTPLNTIISFSNLLLEGDDGQLSEEQRTQVNFVRKAASDLSELVNDLLDLAKVEAGKLTIRPAPFRVEDLFGALRGLLKPLLVSTAVQLVFEEPQGLPELQTDEGKVNQILRNFISNALKFTERGEVRVRAQLSPDGQKALFSVADTGIGIALQDQERIFVEFGQVESKVQKKVKGTGLGLPLSRKLAELLGGSVYVKSEPGEGSTFFAEVPLRYQGPTEVAYVAEPSRRIDPTRIPVLMLEDNAEALLVYDRFLRGTAFQPVPCTTLAEARRLLRILRPVAIVLDILIGDDHTWDFLSELKGSEATRSIPVVVATVVDEGPRAKAMGADAFVQKPVSRDWLMAQLQRYAETWQGGSLLVIDDDPASRYLVARAVQGLPLQVVEAASGLEGLARARDLRPEVIVLDLGLPDLDGTQVLQRLREDPATRRLPVVVHTSRPLAEGELPGVVVVPKGDRALDALREAVRRARAGERAP